MVGRLVVKCSGGRGQHPYFAAKEPAEAAEAVLSGRAEVGANRREVLGGVVGLEATADLLVRLGHAERELTFVVGKGQRQVGGEPCRLCAAPRRGDQQAARCRPARRPHRASRALRPQTAHTAGPSRGGVDQPTEGGADRQALGNYVTVDTRSSLQADLHLN